jgi:RimJ/RimL family protein N-acetyltransferase
MTIRTARLRIEPVRLAHLQALGQGEAAFGEALGVSVAKDWAGPDAQDAITRSGSYLEANPASADWWMHAIIHEADNQLIGTGGYKGEPAGGMVEIGYELAPAWRGQGLATEAAQGLIDHAFARPDVDHVLAHTLPDANASTRVLKRLGMRFDGEVHDPDDGDIWRWRLDRPQR